MTRTWQFVVRGHRAFVVFDESLPAFQPSLTGIDLFSHPNGPLPGQPNAVAYFYPRDRPLPRKPSPVHNQTLELHFPIEALAGVLALLTAQREVICFYDENYAGRHGPRSGLEQRLEPGAD